MPTQMKLKLKYTLGRPLVVVEMRSALKDYPKDVDAKAPSHLYRSRTGNSSGVARKINKGGKRGECRHAITGHGPCACKN